MNFLLYGRHGHVTGAALGDMLGIPHGREMPDERVEYLIRWGTSRRIRYIPSERTWNRRRAIEANADKFNSLNIMEAAGISVPPFSGSMFDLEFPMLGRSSSHMQGRDLKLYLQPRDISPMGAPDYFVQYIPKKTEYRVHVIDNRVVKVSEKRLTDESEYDQLVWNYETGWTFRHPSEPIHPHIYTSIAAVNALDLDFGAVDVLVSTDNELYVLEVNTCPGLSDNSLELYVEHLGRLID